MALRPRCSARPRRPRILRRRVRRERPHRPVDLGAPQIPSGCADAWADSATVEDPALQRGLFSADTGRVPRIIVSAVKARWLSVASVIALISAASACGVSTSTRGTDSPSIAAVKMTLNEPPAGTSLQDTVFPETSFLDRLETDRDFSALFRKVSGAAEPLPGDRGVLLFHIRPSARLADVRAMEAQLRQREGVATVTELTQDPCAQNTACVHRR